MTPIKRAGAVLLWALVAAEHVGLLWWGAVWPWGHIAAYPGDGGMNDYLILASCLLVAVSLAAAAAHRRTVPRVSLLAAMSLALPLGVAVLLALLDGPLLDPTVDYLALLPSVAAVIAPYVIAARLTR